MSIVVNLEALAYMPRHKDCNTVDQKIKKKRKKLTASRFDLSAPYSLPKTLFAYIVYVL